MTIERKNVVTFKGGPITLLGAEVKAGDTAPDFCMVDKNLQPVTLASTKGKIRLISVVPSIDTPVCELQSKRFNMEAAKLPDNVAVFTVSVDLPFAQSRWCAKEGADKVQMLSDYKERSFGEAYGVLIKELKLLSRAIFVIDENDKVVYVEYVKEVSEHPDYAKALKSLPI